MAYIFDLNIKKLDTEKIYSTYLSGENIYKILRKKKEKPKE